MVCLQWTLFVALKTEVDGRSWPAEGREGDARNQNVWIHVRRQQLLRTIRSRMDQSSKPTQGLSDWIKRLINWSILLFIVYINMSQWRTILQTINSAYYPDDCENKLLKYWFYLFFIYDKVGYLGECTICFSSALGNL